MKYVGNGRNYFYEGLFDAEEQQDAEQRRAFAREREAQAERIRVLREALEGVLNYASCDYASPFRPHFVSVMKQSQVALEATK